MTITFVRVPGFSDLPDSALAAEKFALGSALTAISENAHHGMVVPEFFQKKYVHDDTVELPISPIDGYRYTRSELVYIWAVHTTQNPKTSWESGPGSFWFGQWFVNQSTGKVTSEEYYRTAGHDNGKSNDGILLVTTVAIRRKASIVIDEIPVFADVDNADLATDKALRTTPLVKMNRNAKFARVASEVIYCGEFVHGETVPAPVSSVDGYEYSYSEVKHFAFSWVWTAPGSGFVTPTGFGGKPQNQLGRLKGAVSSVGLVSLDVIYYDDGEIPTNDGRIAVFAFTARDFDGSIGPGDEFSWVDAADLRAGQPLKTDVWTQVNKNIRESVMRPEFFDAGEFTDGDTVPLPVSPIDGYTYARDECVYLFEMCDSGPETSGNIRIVLWWAWVNPDFGFVQFIRYALLDGGTSVRFVTTGKVRVATVAIRSHVKVDPEAGGTPSPGSIGPGDIGIAGNRGTFSDEGQSLASEWTAQETSGTHSYSQEPGLSPGTSQGITVSAGVGNSAAIRSKRQIVHAGERFVERFRAIADDLALGSNAFRLSLVLFPDDALTEDVIELTRPDLTGSGVLAHQLGLEIPDEDDLVLWTSEGDVSLGVSGLGYSPGWAAIQLSVFEPDVNVTVRVGNLEWFKAVLDLAGRPVSTTQPADQQVLKYDASSKLWLPQDEADVTTFVDEETPSGSINSSNVTFTLAHAPSPAASLRLFLNGIRLKSGGNDFSLSSLTITMTTAPTTGDILLADYRY